ncbi:MAG: WYL domain-containing protein [Sedimentisphaerales bacterium]|nr:WYL domain-containing protein [Sedimentisphaerales bacterium]
MESSKLSRLQRMLRLVTALQSGNYYSPNELADLLGVTRRTVFRDISMLNKAGIPCYHDDQMDGYRLEDACFLPALNLTLSEAMALLIVAQYAGDALGLPLQQQARQAALKVESTLPSHLRDKCGLALKHTSVQLTPRADHPKLDQTFEILQQAIQKQNPVSMHYMSMHDGQTIETTINPVHLHFSRRAWYVIGYSSYHEEARTFKLGRIKRLKVRPEKFTLEKSFSIEKYLGNAWALIPEGKVSHIQLLFDPMVAHNVAEVLWHRTQRTTWQEDGRLLFEAYVDGINEITWWILGYGNQVEVVGPPELRQYVSQIVQNMAQIYDDPATPMTTSDAEPLA